MYPIISNQVDRQELTVILHELETQLKRNDTTAVVEFGCYIGTTSLFIARLLTYYQSAAEFHVYDSFAGLPEKTLQDHSPAGEQFKAGELCISKSEFVKQFKKAGLRLPHIHKNWFNQLSAGDIPDAISFAFLDGDYYESIRDSLRVITPRLTPGAVVIVDDYASEALPGAARAVDEWATLHGRRVQVRHSLACLV
jgi:O-methyltransferase